MYVTVVIVMYIHTISFSQVTAISSLCTWKGNYWSLQKDECSPCSECPAGKFVRARCSKDADTRCARCRHGYFSIGGFKKKCRKCSRPVCEKGFRYIGCKRYRNAACVPCKKNHFYLQATKECKKCSKCPPGHYVSSSCGLYNDTLCEPCPQGTFLESENVQLYCRACRFCRLGEQTIRECTRDHNTECGSCSKGYFRLESSYECAKCSVCYRGYPDYIIEIDECRRNDNTTDSICMPVAYPPFGYKDYEKYDYELQTTRVLPDYWTEDVSYALIGIGVIIGIMVLIGFSILVGICCIKKRRRRKGTEAKNVLPEIPDTKVKDWITRYSHIETVQITTCNSEPRLSAYFNDKPHRNSYPTVWSVAAYPEYGQLSAPLHHTSSEEEEFDLISVSKDDLPSANINELALEESRVQITDDNVSVIPKDERSATPDNNHIFNIESHYESDAEDTVVYSGSHHQVKDDLMRNFSTADTGYCSTMKTKNGQKITENTTDQVRENFAINEHFCSVKEKLQTEKKFRKQRSGLEYNTCDDECTSYQPNAVSMQCESTTFKEIESSILPCTNVKSSTPMELIGSSGNSVSRKFSPLTGKTRNADLIDLDCEIDGAATIYSRNPKDSELKYLNASMSKPSALNSSQASRYCRSNTNNITDERSQKRKCHSMDSACYEDVPCSQMQQSAYSRGVYYSENQMDSYLQQFSCRDTFAKHMEDEQNTCKCSDCCDTQSL